MRDTRPVREPAYEQLIEQERLILAATELVHELLEDQGVTKTELARRLDRTKGYVTQLLAGDRNLTLRTLADLVGALGHRVGLTARPVRQRPPEELQVRQHHMSHGSWLATAEARGGSFESRNLVVQGWRDCRRLQDDLGGTCTRTMTVHVRAMAERAPSDEPVRVQ